MRHHNNNITSEIQLIGTESQILNKTVHNNFFLISNNKTNNEKNVNYHVLHDLNRKFSKIQEDGLMLNKENREIFRIKRFLAFLSFFIAFILIIFILSKFYSSLNDMITRKKRYGYYFNMKLEHFLFDFKNRMKYKKMQQQQQQRNNIKQEQVVQTIYEKDMGHINQCYDSHNELVTFVDSLSLASKKSVVDKKENKNFLTKYFDQKRLNSFEYDQFTDENDSIDNNSNRNKNMNSIIKYFNRARLRKNESFKLFKMMPKNSHSDNSYIQLKKLKSVSNSSGFDESYSSSSNNSTVFDLPIILVTDTSKMHTIIIDLDSFEPEKLSHNDLLLKYGLNDEKRPTGLYELSK